MNIKEKNNDYEKIINNENLMMIENASIDFMIEFNVPFSIFQNIIRNFNKFIFEKEYFVFQDFCLYKNKWQIFNNDGENKIQTMFSNNEKHNLFMHKWISNVLDSYTPLEIFEGIIITKNNKNNYKIIIKNN